jgi:regulator of protease activity HflC (stomatin/prohibitin superfamily)
MTALVVFLVGLAVVVLIGLTLSVKVVTQYQKGVLFRLGKVVGVKEPGLALIIPVIDRLVRVSLRIVTMPIQSQGIILATTSASTFPRSPTSASWTR